MKKLLFLLLTCFVLATLSPIPAFADWSYGNITFRGDKPSNSLTHGNVVFYYSGTLRQVGISGNTEIWECTGDVCVIFGKNYRGPKIDIRAQGRVQYGRL